MEDPPSTQEHQPPTPRVATPSLKRRMSASRALRLATQLSHELKTLDSLRIRTRRKQKKLLRIAAGDDEHGYRSDKENYEE